MREKFLDEKADVIAAFSGAVSLIASQAAAKVENCESLSLKKVGHSAAAPAT